jgi:hypothetical protein
VVTDCVAAGIVVLCNGARALGAAQTIITKATDRSSRPAAPVSHVDFERDLLTTAVIVGTPSPRWNPRPVLTVGTAPQKSDGADPRIRRRAYPPADREDQHVHANRVILQRLSRG